MMKRSKEKKEKKNRIMPIWLGVLIFIFAFLAGVISKFVLKPAWQSQYSVAWSDEIGTKITDISYGDGEANKFDIYLPKDSSKDTYGLVVYLHAGGFTSGDKADDESMLAWLCSKGYVAAGINYTLRTDTNNASVLLESNEMESCRFVTTAAGTAVYAGDGSYLGLYETEDAAVEMIRLMLSEYSDGGSADEI